MAHIDDGMLCKVPLWPKLLTMLLIIPKRTPYHPRLVWHYIYTNADVYLWVIFAFKATPQYNLNEDFVLFHVCYILSQQ